MTLGCLTSDIFSPPPKPAMLYPGDAWRAKFWADVTTEQKINGALTPRYRGFDEAYSVYVNDYEYTKYLAALSSLKLEDVPPSRYFTFNRRFAISK